MYDTAHLSGLWEHVVARHTHTHSNICQHGTNVPRDAHIAGPLSNHSACERAHWSHFFSRPGKVVHVWHVAMEQWIENRLLENSKLVFLFELKLHTRFLDSTRSFLELVASLCGSLGHGEELF